MSEPSASSLRLLCFNINGLPNTLKNAALRHGSWLGFFQHHRLDIACLQEAKVADDKLTKDMCCVDGYQSFWACSSTKKGYSGVTTYAAKKVAPVACEIDNLEPAPVEEQSDDKAIEAQDDRDNEKSTLTDAEKAALSIPPAALQGEGRCILTDHGSFVVINVYVPNAGERPDRPRLSTKLHFLRALRARCEALAAAGREIILVGDFNVSADEKDVHPRIGLHKAYSKLEQDVFKSFFTCQAKFVDIWRHLHPDISSTYTVWDEKTSARVFNEGLRIDYILVTPGLIDKVVSCEVLGTEDLPPKFSDHAGVLLELKNVESARGTAAGAGAGSRGPCPEWIKLEKRFIDRSQKSIASFFSKKSTGADGGGSAKRSGSQAATEATHGDGAATNAKRQKN